MFSRFPVLDDCLLGVQGGFLSHHGVFALSGYDPVGHTLVTCTCILKATPNHLHSEITEGFQTNSCAQVCHRKAEA